MQRRIAPRSTCQLDSASTPNDATPLGTDGVSYAVRKYGLAAGIDLHPHALRHTMATEYLAATENDLVGLAQVLGHESIQTTSRYTQRPASQLAEATERMVY